MDEAAFYCTFAVHAKYKRRIATMPAPKTAVLTLRIDPALKEALRTVAEQEHRSIANMIEVLIRHYCKEHGVVVSEQRDFFSDR